MVTSMPETNYQSTQGALAQRLGIHATADDSSGTVFTMPVEGNTQVRGVLHGGATAALCEHAASRSANAHAATLGKFAVGTELTVSHLRPASSGSVTATASALHLGRTRTVHRVEVRDDEGQLTSIALVTNLLLEPRATD